MPGLRQIAFLVVPSVGRVSDSGGRDCRRDLSHGAVSLRPTCFTSGAFSPELRWASSLPPWAASTHPRITRCATRALRCASPSSGCSHTYSRLSLRPAAAAAFRHRSALGRRGPHDFRGRRVLGGISSVAQHVESPHRPHRPAASEYLAKLWATALLRRAPAGRYTTTEGITARFLWPCLFCCLTELIYFAGLGCGDR